jgi:hypothetical protein
MVLHNYLSDPVAILVTESTTELYRLSDRRLLAKLVTTFVGRWRNMVSATDPYALNLGILDRSRYFSFK